MSEIIPLFKSHYSIGKSILTLEKKGTSVENGPDSIIDIAVENELQEIFLIEDNLGGVPQANNSCLDAGIKLNVGWRVSLCADKDDKSSNSLDTVCKFVILVKNNTGFQDLIKIHNQAAKKDFYYEPRTDYKTLEEMWTDNLILCVPFYDSFIFQNLLTTNRCIPCFNFTKPVFFVEDNDLPFDSIIAQQILEFNADDNFPVIRTKSVYYKNRKNFKAYLTKRCIDKRTVLNKPQLEHMHSDEFCIESWKEQNAKLQEK